MFWLGLDEYSFSQVYNEETAKDGEHLCKIERIGREDEILKQIKIEQLLAEQEHKKIN